MAANPANPANPLVPEVDVSGHLSLIDKNKLTEQLRHSIIAKLTPEVKKDADESKQEYRYAGDQTGFREWKKAVLTSCIMFGFERMCDKKRKPFSDRHCLPRRQITSSTW